MSNGVPLSEVTTANLGCWIEGSSVRNPVEFSVAIVDLAISHGLVVKTEVWEEDRTKFYEGEFSFDMLEDLSYVTDIALEFLNSSLPQGFFFDFEDGLCLFADEDLSEKI